MFLNDLSLLTQDLVDNVINSIDPGVTIGCEFKSGTKQLGGTIELLLSDCCFEPTKFYAVYPRNKVLSFIQIDSIHIDMLSRMDNMFSDDPKYVDYEAYDSDYSTFDVRVFLKFDDAKKYLLSTVKTIDDK